jgi:small subunit ribosomal protein S9
LSDETTQPDEQEPIDAPAAEQPEETTPEAEAAAPAADAPDAQADEAPAAEQAPAEAVADEPVEVEEPAERVKPEIPGADLVPDIVPEGEAAIAEGAESDSYEAADEAVADAGDESVEEEIDAQPIEGAAIDLAKDARYEATGKRKSAVARVTLKPGKGEYIVNGRELNEMFPRLTLQRNIRQPLEAVGYESKMDVIALIHGGGVSAQADALRHGISRALVKADPNLRGELKRRGFLTRDPRVVERKKAGLKKARKRPQFSKR